MDPDRIHDWLRGPMVAVATPFTEDFELDLDALRTNIRFMIDRGVETGQGSLLVGGAGGEHPVLNIEERMAVMTASVEAANGEAPVLTSIQHTDHRATVEMALHAEAVGVQGGQLGPTYYYDSTESDARRLFERVAGQTSLTLMIYHTWWDGLVMSPELLRDLVRIPTVKALKWSHPDNAAYREGLQEFAGQLATIDNSNNHVLSHMYGATGFITHLSGFWPEYPLDIWNRLEAKDYDGVRDRLAEFKWPWATWRSKVAAVTGGEGPFIKAAMEAVGLSAGPPRPPSIRPPDELLVELRALLVECKVPMARAELASAD
ncbi:MAG TPA: dihydrodipicolinate synthase family protein [Dehalococcoidia bacterium]|jgi:dihydrodipicolinate synthase/N-acetylneuraminate lyase|nr:dihydrodipicolinate synthase family protein [Dehalococcoidia bacterium]